MLVFRPGSSGLLLFTFLFLALQSAFSQPANDQCSNPIVIDSSNYTNSQSNAGATAAGDPPPSCNSGQGSGVWYQFTPPTNGVIIVDTSDSDFDTVLAVFTGSCGSLTEIACDDDSFDITSRTASLVSAGVPYLILAGGLDGATGSMVLHLNFTANMLSNDLCSGAIVISGTNYSNSQFTALATSTGDPPPSCPDSPGNGVWYQYTPSTNGLIVVDTAGSDFDTVLAVYTGSCGSLVEVGCNDDANGLVSTSLLTNVVAAGTTYYILAGGWGGQYGNMNFHLNFALGPPENDQCSNAILIAGTSYTHTQSTERATSLNDPASCSAISNGVWYRYTPAANGAIVVDTAGSDFDTVLAVYTGSCGAFTQVGCNDNVGNSTSRVSILGGAGTNYYILAGGFNGATGTLVLNLNFTAGTLPNDQCAGAIVISSPTYTNTQSTVTATSTGDPSVTCVGNFGSGVWYQYTPPLGGTMVVDTVGSSFDTVLAVFTNACGSLTEVGCNDQAGGQSTSQLTNVVTANTAYHILAGGWGSQAGTLVLHLSFVEGPPANDQCAGAIVITNSPYSNTQSTFKATSTNDPTPDCTPLGKGVWYQYTPNVTGAMVVDTAGSDFDTALAVYAGDCNNLTQVGCNDNSGNVTSRASIQAAAGTNYFILAGGFNSATGALTLQLSFTPGTLANDQCSGAIIASGNSYTNTQSTLTATTTGDQIPSCVPNSGSAVWYQYTPAATGKMAVDTFGSGFDTVLALYSGTCDSLIEIGCNDQAGGSNASQIIGPVSSGTTYYISAGGWGSQAGNLVFHLGFAQAPQVTNDPISKTVAAGDSVTFAVAASGTQPLSYFWQRDGQFITGATASSYTTNNIPVAASGNQFSCVVSNLGGMATSHVAVLTVVLTNTFANTNAIIINDAAVATPYPSSINVSGQSGIVGKVNVALQGFYHQFPHDVGVLLAGPQGQTVVLMADAGGGQPASNLTLTFDDNATSALGEFDPLTSGSYQPADFRSGGSFPAPAPVAPYGSGLFAFRGADPNGLWSLYVFDSTSGDSGNIARGWKLTLANEEPLQITQQPQNQAVPAGGTATFNVQAAGAFPLSYAWQKNGINLNNGGKISGATSPNLAISNVQNADAANYSVVVSCASGIATSAVANLSVLAAGQAWIVPASIQRNNNQFQFTLFGSPGSTYEVLVSSDLKNWTLLKVVTMTSTTALIVDSTAGLPRRFYRARLVNLPAGQPWLLPDSLSQSGGQFQFTLLGAPGSNYEILVSSDLLSWKVLKTLSLTNTTALVQDPDVGVARRFYRARRVP